jgi:pyrroline-5-carboxylate reductase
VFKDNMRIGFVGTGTITEAIVKGMLKAGVDAREIWLSPRNHEIARRLADSSNRVHVGTSNQDVLDHCEVVCLAVRPQIAVEVLKDLRFAPGHHVLSFIATFSRQKLGELVAPATDVVRAVPLPFVAECMGPTIICPHDAIAKELFDALGRTVEVADDHAFEALAAVTACMGSFFALLQGQSEWLVDQGIDQAHARDFLSSFYLGLANAATLNSKPFSTLTREFMTAGGLNEQVYTTLAAQGHFKAHDGALDGVLRRVRKASDAA